MNRKKDIEWLKANNLIDDLTSMYIVKFRLQKMDEFRSINNYYNSDKIRNFVAIDYTEEEFDRGYLYEWVYFTYFTKDKTHVYYGYVYLIDQYHGNRTYMIAVKYPQINISVSHDWIYRNLSDIANKYQLQYHGSEIIVIGEK